MYEQIRHVMQYVQQCIGHQYIDVELTINYHTSGNAATQQSNQKAKLALAPAFSVFCVNAVTHYELHPLRMTEHNNSAESSRFSFSDKSPCVFLHFHYLHFHDNMPSPKSLLLDFLRISGVTVLDNNSYTEFESYNALLSAPKTSHCQTSRGIQTMCFLFS